MQAIHDFLNERKEAWLKKMLKTGDSEEEQARVESEAHMRFSLAAWLPDAARRAGQLSMASHPSKFSHPSARSSSIIAQATQKTDGYLRTGNVEYALDVFGNAAAMDVYKFLDLSLSDGRSVLEHLETDSQVIQKIMAIPDVTYAELKTDFLAIKHSDHKQLRTDGLIKQVYFPIDEQNYHLLSLLTPSGLLGKLKTTLDQMRFSETAKAAREARKEGKMHETGFDDILNLTVTAYGGTQPQNISVLNSQNAGRAYLLMSAPPALEHRKIRLPTKDFFTSRFLYTKTISEPFENLHSLMQEYVPNNRHTRRSIQNIIDYINWLVLEYVRLIRANPAGWSDRASYSGLPKDQKIWLDDQYAEQRATDEDWLENISKVFARWFIRAYEYHINKKDKQAIMLGNAEFTHIKQLVQESLEQDKEFLQ